MGAQWSGALAMGGAWQASVQKGASRGGGHACEKGRGGGGGGGQGAAGTSSRMGRMESRSTRKLPWRT